MIGGEEDISGESVDVMDNEVNEVVEDLFKF
jgi:hypothetical protein